MYHVFQLALLGQAQPESPSLLSYALFPLLFVVFYFLLIRPASKQRKEHEQLLNQLKKGDEVTLNGGIYGKITAIDDRVATVEIANNVKVKVLRDRIAGRWPAPKGEEDAKGKVTKPASKEKSASK